ncbi:MFS general substrate transporter, partial [Glonium stellatum]
MPVVVFEAKQNAHHINLRWRSWVVIFITSFAFGGQVFATTAAGANIAFIVRDLGEPEIAGWIIQGPLLMQSILSPVVGRLSDVLDRKYMASIPPLIALIGAIISAKATSMTMLIGGGILIGACIVTAPIVHAIQAEVMPLKYRALANAFTFIGTTVGTYGGGLGGSAATNTGPSGWRYIFWIQIFFHGATSLGFLLFYWPPRRSDYPTMSLKEYIWTCDPIGSFFFIGGTTLLLLAFDWAGGTYRWSNVHVAVPLGVAIALLIIFGLYEWKGRKDGIVAHVFFQSGPNFPLAVFAFTIEGWVFYSAVNSFVPQAILNLGFEDNAWDTGIRQLSYGVPSLFASWCFAGWATHYKDLKRPLILSFTLFLIASV